MSEGTTKKPAGRSHHDAADDFADEYQFDYSQSRPNRFASHVDEDAVVVVLDPDVAEVVRDPKPVNALPSVKRAPVT